MSETPTAQGVWNGSKYSNKALDAAADAYDAATDAAGRKTQAEIIAKALNEDVPIVVSSGPARCARTTAASSRGSRPIPASSSTSAPSPSSDRGESMRHFVLRRLAAIPVTLFAVSCLVFLSTQVPIRYHIPRADVRLDLFTGTEPRTGCPYKGTAEDWSLTDAGGSGIPANVAWSYPDPLPAVATVKGHIAFYNEAVDILVDGERLERPVTQFTARLTASPG